jgi:FG-GAP repeat
MKAPRSITPASAALLHSMQLFVALRSTVNKFSKRVCRLLVPFLILGLWINPVHSLTESKFPPGSNVKDHDFFGSQVATSGGLAVVGAPAGNPYDAKVYFYKQTQSGWIEQAKFTLPNPANDALFFAESVAISETYAIVGASAYDGYGKSKAFIYHYDGSNWVLDQIIEPSNNFGQVFDNRFGQSVAISGDLAIVGASDRAYIFKRSATGWSEQKPFLTSGNSPSRRFGYAVSINGNYAIVGGNDALAPVVTPATTHIFFFDGVSWTNQAILSPGNGLKGGTRQAVSISGDYAIVGHTTANFSNRYEGKAYIFVRNGTQWMVQADLKSTPGPSTRFGWSVSIGSKFAAVGDPCDNKGGAAYLFSYDGSPVAKINASDLVNSDFFGQSVGIDGTRIVVGAPHKSGPAGFYQGATYGYLYFPAVVRPRIEFLLD